MAVAVERLDGRLRRWRPPGGLAHALAVRTRSHRWRLGRWWKLLLRTLIAAPGALLLPFSTYCLGDDAAGTTDLRRDLIRGLFPPRRKMVWALRRGVRAGRGLG